MFPTLISPIASAPVSALSAVAARRARQQKIEWTEQPSETKEAPLDGEPPSKRARPVPSDTNDDGVVKDPSDRTTRHSRRRNGQVIETNRREKSAEPTTEHVVIGEISASDSDLGPEENTSVISELTKEDESGLEGQEYEEG
jgi:hypothetical protein